MSEPPVSCPLRSRIDEVASSVKIAVVTLSENGKVNIGVEVVKMAAASTRRTRSSRVSSAIPTPGPKYHAQCVLAKDSIISLAPADDDQALPIHRGFGVNICIQAE